MFCNKCGRPVEGDQLLCDSCAAEQAAQATGAPEATAPSCDTFELNSADKVPAKKAPKKKTGLIVGIAAAVVAVAVAVGIVLNLGSIKGFIGRTFQEPEDYLADVESAAISQYTADLTQSYGKLLERHSEKLTAGKVDIRLTLGDELLSLLETSLRQEGAVMGLDWLRNIRLSVDANLDDTTLAGMFGLGLGNNDLLSLNVIYDTEKGLGYLAIPELSDDYIYTDLSTQLPAGEINNILSSSMELSDQLVKALPSEAEMNELINTYVSIILSCIDNVERETDTITVDGVSQKVVVLTAKITEEDLVDIVEKILKQAEKDKLLEKTLDALSDYINGAAELNNPYYTPVDLHQQLTDAIPSALESLVSARENAEKGNYLELTVYVDMKNNLRGHELCVYADGKKESTPISWLTVVEGNTTYTEAELGEVLITGEKAEKKGVSEGSYDLSVSGMEIGTLKFEDVTETAGTLRLIPSEDLLSEALSGSGIPSALLGGGVSLELSYSTEGDKLSYEVNVLVGPKALLGLALSSEYYEGGSISIPSDALYANEANLMQWLQNADFDRLLNALKEADIPQELINTVESYVNMLKPN